LREAFLHANRTASPSCCRRMHALGDIDEEELSLAR
jgi:hypothetical protein